MRKLLCLLSFMVVVSLVEASEKKTLQIDRDAWEKSTQHLEYEPQEKQQPKERTNYEMPNLWWLKYVAYVVVAIVIISLLFMILRNARPVQRVSKERIEAQSLEEAEENLPEVTLNKIFEEALEVADYKKALRIKFLMVLQSMIDKQMIIWKKRKTNEQYLYEIKDETLFSMFRNAVLTFDDVWYGEVRLSEQQYDDLISGLDRLNLKINGS